MKSVLHIFLDDIPGEAAEYVDLQWVLVDENGVKIESGETDGYSELPQVQRMEIILPASKVFLTRIRLPERNAGAIKKVLRFAVEDQLATDPEKVHVAYGPQIGNELPVAVVDRDWLSGIIGSFEECGISVSACQVETLCLPLAEDRWSVFIGTREAFVRTGDYSGIVLDVTSDGSTPLSLISAINDHDMGIGIPDAIDVYIGPGVAEPNADQWSSAIGAPVTIKGHWDRKQAATEVRMQGINLLQGELALKLKIAEFMPALKTTAALLTVLATLILSTVFLDWALLTREEHRLNTEMREMFMAAFPDTKEVVNAPLQMQRKLAELRLQTEEAGDNGMLPMLSGVSRALDGRMKYESIQYSKEKLTVVGVSGHTMDTSDLKDSLLLEGIMILDFKAIPDEYGSKIVFSVIEKTI